MNDDIVTRLRNHVRGDYEKTSDFMLGLAADEIERLRLLLAHICDVWGSDLRSIVEEMNRFRKEIK